MSKSKDIENLTILIGELTDQITALRQEVSALRSVIERGVEASASQMSAPMSEVRPTEREETLPAADGRPETVAGAVPISFDSFFVRDDSDELLEQKLEVADDETPRDEDPVEPEIVSTDLDVTMDEAEPEEPVEAETETPAPTEDEVPDWLQEQMISHENIVQTKKETAPAQTPSAGGINLHLKAKLTIADRYLFANELFGGSVPMLLSVLDDLEAMSSWTQVEDYLFNVMHLNPDDEVAAIFIDFVERGAL